MNLKIGGMLLAAPALLIASLVTAASGESILIILMGMLGGALVGLHAVFLRMAKLRRRAGERNEIAARPVRAVRRHAVASLILLDAALLLLFASDLENGIVGYMSGFGGSLVIGPVVGIFTLRQSRRLRGSEAVFAGTIAAFFAAVVWGLLTGTPVVEILLLIGYLIVIVVDVLIITANWWWPPPIEADPLRTTNKAVQGNREPLPPDGNP